jgi:PAS domain S-box-containing protein
MQERLVLMQQQTPPTLSQQQQLELMARTFEELSTAMEELRSANEQLLYVNDELSVAHQRYQDLFEFAPDAYLVTDPYGLIQEANCAAATLLNIPQWFLMGTPLFLYIIQQHRQAFSSKLAELGRVDRVQEWEVCLQPRDSTLITVAITVAVVRDQEGKSIGLRWMLRDISDRKVAEAEIEKALQKERELNELKSRFISISSHEFRTPLTTISSSAELLERYRDRYSEEKQLTHLYRIKTAVGQIAQLLDDVLLVGKAEAGKLEFNPEPLDLVSFCRDLLADLQLSDQNQHKISFTYQCSCTLTTQCTVNQNNSFPLLDEKLLRYILGNLLSNAIKYSHRGGAVQLNLSCFDNQAIFKIQDSGIGIPPEDVPHLFETFHRASNVGTIQGTGLGLAIVKQCVDLHRGEIKVESVVGKGTTFTIKLPLNDEIGREAGEDR